MKKDKLFLLLITVIIAFFQFVLITGSFLRIDYEKGESFFSDFVFYIFIAHMLIHCFIFVYCLIRKSFDIMLYLFHKDELLLCITTRLVQVMVVLAVVLWASQNTLYNPVWDTFAILLTIISILVYLEWLFIILMSVKQSLVKAISNYRMKRRKLQ